MGLFVFLWSFIKLEQLIWIIIMYLHHIITLQVIGLNVQDSAARIKSARLCWNQTHIIQRPKSGLDWKKTGL